jgi:hypothetical protein
MFYIVLLLSITFEIMAALQYRMLIQMRLCRAPHDFKLASYALFSKCLRTFGTPCTLVITKNPCRFTEKGSNLSTFL